MLERDKKGICASSGSACTSGEAKPSHVLTAIGLEQEYIQGALRITIGEFNTKAQIDYLVENLVEDVNKLRKIKM